MRSASWVGVSCVAASGLLVVMGVLGPGPTADQTRAEQEFSRQVGRLRAAVVHYVEDMGVAPRSVADLSGGYCGGLRDARFAPAGRRAAWRGPYLAQPCARPTPNGFVGLESAQRRVDLDADGERDELWATLYAAGNELPFESVRAYDRRVDDGDLATGRVQWREHRLRVHLLEL